MRKVRILFLVFLILSFTSQSWASSAISAFTYYKGLNGNTTSGGANVSGNLGGGTITTGFPVCVHICPHCSSPNFSSGEMGHFFGSWNVSGKRVQFFASDQTTNLNYEVEYYNATSGSEEAVYWVAVPTVTGNNANSNLLYVAYGNDPNSSSQDNKAGVWDSNFQGVYHLGDNSWAGSAPEATDSTSNAKNGTNTSTTDVAGEVRRGRAFDNTPKYITTSSPISLTGNITISLWASIALPGSGGYVGILNDWDGINFYGYLLQLYNSSGTQQITFATGNGGYHASTLNYTFPNSSWYKLDVVYDGAHTTFYKNATSAGSVAQTNNAHAVTATNFRIGRRTSDDPTGSMDEIRISSTNRSADWLTLEYYTESKTNWNGDGWITWNSEQQNVSYQLSVTLAGTGTGTVTSSPSGINCGSTCSYNYSSGTSVTLSQSASSGSGFAGWSGDCSGTGSCSLTMTAAHSVTATFTTYSIAASAGSGGTISPSGTTYYAPGANQQFTISPNSGYCIVAVVVDSVSQGVLSSYTFSNIQANHTISVTFSSTATVTPSVTGSGTINPSTPQSVTCGQTQQFTLTPNACSELSSVTGTCGGSLTNNVFTTSTVSQPCTVIGNFINVCSGWLSGYDYRKSLFIIPGSPDGGTNYQMKLHIYSGTGTDSSGVVYLNGNSQIFPNDFRFTKNDGITPISFYIDPDSGTSTDKYVFIKIPTDVNNTQSIILYYGNALAQAASSGDNTFDFFDSFPTVWTRQALTGLSDGMEPNVFYDNNPQILTGYQNVWKMWYSGFSGSNFQGNYYAESADGYSWTNYSGNPVAPIWHCWVFKNNGTYYMFGADTSNTYIYRYHSSDGLNWTSDGVVINIPAGSNALGNSMVWIRNGTWYNMFDTFVNGAAWEDSLASSSDGLSWTLMNSGSPVLTDNISGAFSRYPNPLVGNNYIFWVIAMHSRTCSSFRPTDVYRLRSIDLINWTWDSLYPTFSRYTQDEGVGDCNGQSADPNIWEQNGTSYLYYSALQFNYTPNTTHVKLATAPYSFDQLSQTTEDALNLNKWNVVMQDATACAEGNAELGWNNLANAQNMPALISKTYQIGDGIIEAKSKGIWPRLGSTNMAGGIWFRRSTNTSAATQPLTEGQIAIYGATSGSENSIWVSGTNKANVATAAISGNYYYFRLIANGVNLTANRYTDSLFSQNQVSTSYTDTGGLTSGYIGATSYTNGDAIFLKWIRVRKYVATEPYFGYFSGAQYSMQGHHIPGTVLRY